jgi:hypothetical protein
MQILGLCPQGRPFHHEQDAMRKTLEWLLHRGRQPQQARRSARNGVFRAPFFMQYS